MQDDHDGGMSGGAGAPPGPPGSDRPGAPPPPPPAEPPPPPPGGPDRPDRPGLPWERRAESNLLQAAVETVRDVLLSPAAAFQQMRQVGGFGDPLGYAVLLGSIGAWAGMLWSMLVRSFGIGVLDGNMLDVASQNLSTAVGAALVPVILVVALVVFAGLEHVLLVLFGGAPHPYETTFRVVSFTTGSTALLQLIPLCGGPIAMVWSLIVQIIGLSAAQEVPTGRAAGAVLAPFLFLCCCVAVAGFMSAGFLAMLAHEMG